jgi:hypothetical protein
MRGGNFSLTDQQFQIIQERAQGMKGNQSRALRSLIDDAQGKCYRLRNQLRLPLKELAAQCLELRRQHPPPAVVAMVVKIQQAALEIEKLVMETS